MTDDQLALIPRERILTETDFPSSTRRTGASKPGDVAQVESRLDALQSRSARDLVWSNFSRIVQVSGAAERLPESVLRYLA
jgi:TatD DNase family protein